MQRRRYGRRTRPRAEIGSGRPHACTGEDQRFIGPYSNSAISAAERYQRLLRTIYVRLDGWRNMVYRWDPARGLDDLTAEISDVEFRWVQLSIARNVTYEIVYDVIEALRDAGVTCVVIEGNFNPARCRSSPDEPWRPCRGKPGYTWPRGTTGPLLPDEAAERQR